MLLPACRAWILAHGADTDQRESSLTLKDLFQLCSILAAIFACVAFS